MTGPHWEEVYATRAADEVSWYQRDPATSVRLVEALAADRSAGIVDVGSGASFLVDRLLADGYRDVTLVDVSARALDGLRTRLGEPAGSVTFVLWLATHCHRPSRMTNTSMNFKVMAS